MSQLKNNDIKIIITGANGFIGSACLELLKEKKFEIHALSSKNRKNENGVIWHQINIANSEEIDNVFKKIAPSHLLHLAWDVANKDYNGNHHYNWISISLTLLKAFSENGGKRVVAAGTCAEYDWSTGFCQEYNTPIVPNSVYAFSKDAFHRILKSFCEKNELSFVWGRIFFAYGPGENPNSLISHLIENLSNNIQVEIKHANLSRDYIHIEDIARAFVAMIQSNVQGAVNIANAKSITLKEISQIVSKKLKKEHLVKLTIKEEDKMNTVKGDNARLINELGIIPSVSIEEGILKSIESIV